MDIKKTYSYYIKENLRTNGIIYLVVFAVTFLVFLFALFIGESFVFSDLSTLVPNFFTVFIVSFILGIISNRTMDLNCNQFGKSRKTSFITNLLVMFTIAGIVAVVLSTLLTIFYTSMSVDYAQMRGHFNNPYIDMESNTKYLSRFSFWIFNIAYYAFLSIFATSIGVFIYSLWVRLEKLYRWIVFLFIPIVLAYLIPKTIISIVMNGYNSMGFVNKLISFFGLEHGFSYQFIFVSILVFVIPILIIAYFIMLKKPLYGKKN